MTSVFSGELSLQVILSILKFVHFVEFKKVLWITALSQSFLCPWLVSSSLVVVLAVQLFSLLTDFTSHVFADRTSSVVPAKASPSRPPCFL